MTDQDNGGSFNYGQYARKKYMVIGAGITLCVIMFFVDLLLSTSSYLEPKKILQALLHPNDVSHALKVVVYDIRLPSALIGLIVGAAFGLAGAVMQTILNNPLASPYTLGISAGAGFGAALAMVMGLGGLAALGTYLVPAAAFIFAMISCLGIFLVASAKKFSTDTMVLAGIGLVFFFQALLALMQYLASPDALQGIVFWTFGSLDNSDYTRISIVLVMYLAIFIYMYRKCWVLTAMKLGDSKARSLGINVEQVRKISFVLISLLTATCVSFVGCIGFIGIVGPHMARILLGEDQRFLLPMSCVCGATIMITADFACRIIGNGVAYPIGILTSLVGVPFFFYLLLRKKSVRA